MIIMVKVLDGTMKKLKKSSRFLEQASIKLNSANLTPYSKTIVESSSKKVVEIVEVARKVVKLEKEKVEQLYNTIDKYDKQEIKDLKNSAAKALGSGDKEVAIKKLNKLEKHGKSELVTKLLKEAGYKAIYKSNAKSVFVISSLKKIKSKKEKQKKDNENTATTAVVASTVQKTNTSKKAIKATNAKVAKKTTSKATTVASLKKALKKALKKGDASAVSAYTLLASAIGKKKAKAYTNKLGYNVKYKDNKAVALNKIKEEKNIANVGKNNNKDKNTTNSNNTTTDKNESKNQSVTIDGNNNTDTNLSDNINNNLSNIQDNNNNNNDVVASVDTGKSDTSSTPEPPSNPTNDNNSNTTNNNNNSSNNYTRGETISEENNSVNNTPEITDDGSASDMQEGSMNNDVSADLEDDSNELPKTNNKVTTIDTDTEIEETKKSSGLGKVVPLGLGTIATGAAAVAGVRYLKNRNDSEEDYDEDSEYVDSAEYATDDDDEYLGPAGSVYTDVSESSVDDLYTDNIKEESYIDPEDFEEDDVDDFSNDSALEELNSSYRE